MTEQEAQEAKSRVESEQVQKLAQETCEMLTQRIQHTLQEAGVGGLCFALVIHAIHPESDSTISALGTNLGPKEVLRAFEDVTTAIHGSVQ